MANNLLNFVQDYSIILYNFISKIFVLRKILLSFLSLLTLIAIITNSEGIEDVENYAYVFNEYKKVVKYFNPELSENTANIITDTILKQSWLYGIDARLIMALIAVESRFRPFAISHKGAMGLGQLMPATARKLGINNPFDVVENITGSIRYLREQYDRWSVYGSKIAQDWALASYNAGPEAVAKYRSIPPYGETINFVAKVKKLYISFGGKW